MLSSQSLHKKTKEKHPAKHVQDQFPYRKPEAVSFSHVLPSEHKSEPLSKYSLNVSKHLEHPKANLSKYCLHNMSDGTGLSVFATQSITKDEFVCLYTGEIRSIRGLDHYEFHHCQTSHTSVLVCDLRCG